MVAIYLAPRCAIGARWRGTALPPWSSSRPGDEPGAHSPSIWPCSRWGLAAAASPQRAGRSYRPISPLLRGANAREAVCFCATFRLPRRTDPLRKPGRYPAPCPEEPGLSSPASANGCQGGHPVRTPSVFQSSTGIPKGQTDPCNLPGPLQSNAIQCRPLILSLSKDARSSRSWFDKPVLSLPKGSP